MGSMKFRFLYIFFFLISALGFSQDLSIVEMQFRDYNNLILDKKFSKAIDLYANEKFLKQVPKDVLERSMEALFNAPQVEFKMFEPENLKINKEIISAEDRQYVFINYDQKVYMKFKDLNEVNSDVLTALKREFGEGNVAYNSKTNFYEIQSNKNAVADSADSKNWKFTVLDKNNKELLTRIFPSEVMKHVNL